MELFLTSFQAAAAISVLAALVAFRAAHARFSTASSKVRAVLDVLFLLPLALPSAATAAHPLSLYLPFGSEAMLLAATDSLSALPLFYLCAVMGFRRVDPETVDAARLQGLGRCGTFWRAWVPVAGPWLALGLGLGFLRSVCLALLIAFS